jgi:hypothetical protein
MKEKHLILLFVWSIVLIGFGCSPRASSSSTTATPMERNKVAFDDSNWQDGPKLLPKENLLAALTAKTSENKKRLWRLPIVVEREEGVPGSYRKAYIAVDSTMPAHDRIYLWLHDSALGVPLSERVRQYCGDQSACRLWVAGVWGPDMLTTLGNEGDKKEGAPWPFSLRSVIGPQEGKEATNASAIVQYRDQ